MIRWKFSHLTARFNVPFDIEIHDSQYEGSVVNLQIAGKHPVERTLGTRNADNMRKICGSSVAVRLRGEQGDFEDLFDRNNERFRIKLFVDGDLEDEFIPVPDTFSEPVTAGNFEVTIQGANLASLKQVKIKDILDLDGDRISKLDGIWQILSHFFSMPLVDGTIDYPSGANQDTSALSQIFFSPSRFEDETAYQALEWLISKKHQIRVSRGKFFILPAQEASFVGYEYSGDTIGSAVTYDDNFTAVQLGGRLSTDRTKTIAYDGVERTYQPLEAPNLIRGDFDSLDDFNFVTVPITNWRVGIPKGWEGVTGQDKFRIVATGDESNPVGFRMLLQGNTRLRTNTDESVFTGNFLRLNVSATLNTQSSNNFVFAIRYEVGDYVLTRPVEGKQFGDPVWKLKAGLTERQAVFPLVMTDFREATFFTPALLQGGVPVVTLYTPITVERFLGVGTNFDIARQIQGLGQNDYVEIRQIGIDVVDEEGNLYRESKFTVGTGQLYEYTEQFGDGFSSANPGALFYDGQPTENWAIKGFPPITASLGDLEIRYLNSELKRSRDRVTGAVDTFDTIALIEGKRVNYIKTDYRYGRSEIELVEIVEHDLTAEAEERRTRGRGGGGIDIGDWIPNPFLNFQKTSIGVTRANYNRSTTLVSLRLNDPVNSGKDYAIINENELSSDPHSGVYPFTVRGSATTEGANVGPGNVIVWIQQAFISAPSGSLVVPLAAQEQTIEIKERREVEQIRQELDNLEFNFEEFDASILQAQLDELNDVKLPTLDGKLSQLDQAFEGFEEEFEGKFPITETDIQDDSISTPKLRANSITSPKINVQELLASTIFAQEFVTRAGYIDELIANNAWFNKITSNEINVADFYAQNATITAALLLGSGGVFTNAANDFSIGELGFRLSFRNDGLSYGSSIGWFDGNSPKGSISSMNSAFNSIQNSLFYNVTDSINGEHVFGFSVSPPGNFFRFGHTNMKIPQSIELTASTVANRVISSDDDLSIGFNSDTVTFKNTSNTGNGTVGGANGYIEIQIGGGTRRIALYDAP